MNKHHEYNPVSVRGYYYDLSLSPYTIQGVNNDLYIFPSEKKREMFLKEFEKRVNRLNILLSRVSNLSGQSFTITKNMEEFIKKEIYKEMKRNF